MCTKLFASCCVQSVCLYAVLLKGEWQIFPFAPAPGWRVSPLDLCQQCGQSVRVILGNSLQASMRSHRSHSKRRLLSFPLSRLGVGGGGGGQGKGTGGVGPVVDAWSWSYRVWGLHGLCIVIGHVIITTSPTIFPFVYCCTPTVAKLQEMFFYLLFRIVLAVWRLIFLVQAGLIRVCYIIHRTRTWIAGAVTCVCDLFACVYLRGTSVYTVSSEGPCRVCYRIFTPLILKVRF